MELPFFIGTFFLLREIPFSESGYYSFQSFRFSGGYGNSSVLGLFVLFLSMEFVHEGVKIMFLVSSCGKDVKAPIAH